MKYCMLLLAVVAVASCKDKKKDDIIIVRKPVAEQKRQIQRTGDQNTARTVSWGGLRYSVRLGLKADPSLPTATDGVTDFYDNRATLSIVRPNGTTFLKRTFTKADFKPYVDNAYYKDGVLLGFVFDKAEGGCLKFAVTVGNPDKASDEFVPLELSVSGNGAVAIRQVEDLVEE